MNKKTKLTLLSLATITTISAPIAIVVSQKGVNEIKTTNLDGFDFKQRAGAANAQGHTQPTEQLLNPKTATDFWSLGQKEQPIDPKVWRPKPIMKKFDDAFMAQWVEMAKTEGWRSVEDYQKYLQYKIETNGHTGFDTFGGNSTPETNWLGWHFAQGGDLFTSYNAGMGSTIRPTWKGAENSSWNNINNSIAWYQYDLEGRQFIFDANNVDNGWKRLQYMNRLVPTTANSIRRETTTSLGQDGTNPISNTNPAVTRNKFMVDGELLDALPRGFHKYYYVKIGEHFVRDDNGWKVIVTDRDKEKALSSILNPANTAITKAPDATGSYPNADWKVYDSHKGTIKIKAIDYDAGSVYVKNPEHDRSKLYRAVNGAPIDKTSAETYWTGKFTLVHKEENFTKLVDYPHTWFPQEARTTIPFDRFGQKASETWTHPYNGGGYAFQWVEDGLGGHKIYKALDKLKKTVISWRRNHVSELEPGTSSEDLIFYANWNHVFPKRDWYVELADIYRDTGL